MTNFDTLSFFIGLAAGVIGGVVLFKIFTKNSSPADVGYFKDELAKKQKTLEEKELKINELTSAQAALNAQVQTIEKLQKDFEEHQKNAIKNLAQEILENKIKSLGEQAKTEFSPLRQDITTFRAKLETLEQTNRDGQEKLKQEIKDIISFSGTLKETANDLTAALKGDPATKCMWGEVTLANLLERAGLQKEIDYLEQYPEGRHRLDVLLKLPQNKWLVIDSKTTFTNYMNYAAAKDEEEKQNYLAAHIKDIRDTIKDLSSKKYYQDAQNPKSAVLDTDFVLMFVNPPAALDSALNSDVELISEAWKKGVLLVSAPTLINTIEIVKRIWNIEKQREDMQQVVDLIKKLNVKFTNFLNQFSVASNRLEEASKALQTARGHIDGDKGAILPVINEIQTTYQTEIADNGAIAKAGFDYDGKGGQKTEE